MSLSEKLDTIRAGEANIPPPALAMMHQATDELQNSGQLNDVIKPGCPLPAFQLPNHRNDIVSSDTLLSTGPLIITVYRGLW